MDHFSVSQTKVNLWRKCHRAYHYRYVDLLKKIVKARPLQFGSIIHEMLEVSAEGGDPFKHLDKIGRVNKKLFAAERELYGEIVADARIIMQSYFKYYPKKELRYFPHKGKRAEHNFEVDIGHGLLLKLKVDAFARTENGLRWLVEHKTFSKMPGEDERWRDLQSTLYLYVCTQILGIKDLTGICWNYVKSKSPSSPQVLQSGKLSSRELDTLPLKVKEVIKREGLKEKDYKDLIVSAEENVQTYFRRIYTPANEQVIAELLRDFITTAREVKELHGIAQERSIGRHCSWCDYELLCRTELTGGDSTYVKENHYEPESGKRKAKKKAGSSRSKSRGAGRKVHRRRKSS